MIKPFTGVTLAVPSAFISSSCASYSHETGSMSPAGEALQMLPAIVPLARICGEPTSDAASAMAQNALSSLSAAVMPFIGIAAPMRSTPFSFVTVFSSGMKPG